MLGRAGRERLFRLAGFEALHDFILTWAFGEIWCCARRTGLGMLLLLGLVI